MSHDATEDSVEREIRRSELARRLILHRARTQTIARFTGLTRNRLAALRLRLGVTDEARLRGPSPTSLDVFLHSDQAQSEAAALAALFALYADKTLDSAAPSAGSPSELRHGEQLCEIYEAYLAYHPRTAVRLEEMMLLKRSLRIGETVSVGRCQGCAGLILIDRLAQPRFTCWHCCLSRQATRKHGESNSGASPLMSAIVASCSPNAPDG